MTERMTSGQMNSGLPTIRQILSRSHRRLILFTVLMSGVLLMGSGWIVIRQYSDRNLKLVAQTISYTVEPAIVFGDRDALNQEVASVVDINNVRRVQVFDTHRQILANWEQKSDRIDRNIEAIAGGLLGPSPIENKVTHAGREIGTIRVAGSVATPMRFMLSSALISLCCLVITLLSTRIMARRLDESVVGPLDRVAAMTYEVRTTRAFDRRVLRSGVAEIDRLAFDFNALLAELQGWQMTVTLEKNALQHMATHDSLTGLGNRELFNRHLERMIDDAVRTGKSFGVFYLDADRFKQVNDEFGHVAGDALLMGVAERLGGCIGNDDRAFRLGGDEFAVIVGPPIDRQRLKDLIARIEIAIEAPFRLPDGQSLHATLSIGAALYPDDGDSRDDLLQHADEAMYRHKKDRHGARVTGQ